LALRYVAAARAVPELVRWVLLMQSKQPAGAVVTRATRKRNQPE
jgi:hypothetical protein